MATIEDIRAWALSFPEVEESEHFRFRTPLWKVRGQTFLGVGRDGDTAVLRVSPESADRIAAARPAGASVERRPDARRSYLGLQIALAEFADDDVRALVREAWIARAPKRLAAEIEGR